MKRANDAIFSLSIQEMSFHVTLCLQGYSRKKQKVDSVNRQVHLLLLSNLYSLFSWTEIHIRRFQLRIAQEVRLHLHPDPIQRGGQRVDAHQAGQ